MRIRRSAFFLALCLGLVIGGCQDSPHNPDRPAAKPPPPTRGVIVCLGDSLTAGYGLAETQAYPAQLESLLQAAGHNYRVINAGLSGETSSGALSRLEWALKLAPDIVILETGANDGLRGIDPALTQRNIEAIVARLQAADITVVLAGMQMVRNLGRPFTKAFADIYPAVAAKFDLIYMPFFLDGVAGRRDLNQSDGIHPTAEGYAIITTNLLPLVEAAIARHEDRQ